MSLSNAKVLIIIFYRKVKKFNLNSRKLKCINPIGAELISTVIHNIFHNDSFIKIYSTNL